MLQALADLGVEDAVYATQRAAEFIDAWPSILLPAERLSCAACQFANLKVGVDAWEGRCRNPLNMTAIGAPEINAATRCERLAQN